MYSCYDAYVVYGVMEGDRNTVLDREWLDTHFPNMSIYASDVVRNTMGNAVYGCTVHLCIMSGHANVTDEVKEDVQKLYDLLCKHCKESGQSEPMMGYFTAVSGDYEEDHDVYAPDVQLDEDSEDEN